MRVRSDPSGRATPHLDRRPLPWLQTRPEQNKVEFSVLQLQGELAGRRCFDLDFDRRRRMREAIENPWQVSLGQFCRDAETRIVP